MQYRAMRIWVCTLVLLNGDHAVFLAGRLYRQCNLHACISPVLYSIMSSNLMTDAERDILQTGVSTPYWF